MGLILLWLIYGVVFYLLLFIKVRQNYYVNMYVMNHYFITLLWCHFYSFILWINYLWIHYYIVNKSYLNIIKGRPTETEIKSLNILRAFCCHFFYIFLVFYGVIFVNNYKNFVIDYATHRHILRFFYVFYGIFFMVSFFLYFI